MSCKFTVRIKELLLSTYVRYCKNINYLEYLKISLPQVSIC
jgi:hypothetical protein